MRIYTIWPAGKDGQPGGNWRQNRRWLVLDVTLGLARVVVVKRCTSRDEAIRHEMELRSAQHAAVSS